MTFIYLKVLFSYIKYIKYLIKFQICMQIYKQTVHRLAFTGIHVNLYKIYLKLYSALNKL